MPATLIPHVDRDQETVSIQTPDIGLFQDIPRRVWAVFLSAWAMFFGLMILFFATNAAAAFVVAIAVLFGLMAFGLPMALAAQSECGKYECMGIIHTHTGPLSVRAAGAQIAMIPIAAVIGLTAFIMLAI
jgi:hypothetical protein